jgi:xylulokinase
MSVLGIDIGTGSCKAAVFNADGRQLSEAQRPYSLHFTDDGGAELDSELVMECCLSVIREAAQRAGADKVQAIGVSSQGEAFTAIDQNGRALGPAMVSSDVRAAKFSREWPQEFGPDHLYQITGHTAHTLFSLFKLLWLKANRPGVWRDAAKFLCFEDLLHTRLGVPPAMGWPLAGRTMLFDVRQHEWSGEILDRIGLARERLATPLPSGTIVGEIQADLGLAKGAVVVTGGHDQTCGALGAGAVEPGMAMYATGSVECICPTFASPVLSAELQRNNLCTYDHVIPGRYATVAYSLTGGNILRWFKEQFAPAESYDALLASAAQSPTKLLVLPYWTPSGTPYFDVNTPGAICGLRMTTTRGEILRALLEGVALEMRLNLEILRESGCEVNELRAIGGGARSQFWTQLKADVINRPITRLNVEEAGCLGAAMLAFAAVDGESLASLVRRWVKPLSVVTPNVDNLYDALFSKYRESYPLLRRLPEL